MASPTTTVRNNLQQRVLEKPPAQPTPPSNGYDPFQGIADALTIKATPDRRASPKTVVPFAKHSSPLPMVRPSGDESPAMTFIPFSNPSGPVPTGSHSASSTLVTKKEIMTSHPAMVEKTPVPKRPAGGPTYGRSSSLIGFDPLATPSTTASTTASPFISYPPSPLDAPHSAPTTRAHVPLAAIKNGTFQNLLVRPPTPTRKSVPMVTREKEKTLTPKPQSSTDMSNKHRRDVQSFCTSDLRSISSEAIEQENVGSALEDSLVISSSSHMDFGVSKVMPSPSQPKPTQEPKEKATSGIPAAEAHKKEGGARPGRISSMLPPLSMDTAITPKKDGQQKEASLGPNSTPRKRVLQWAKKTHSRIQSLENKEMTKPVTPSASSTPSSERKSSMYPSMIQDLMELSFSQLQMPSLAKPSPTSFLTGKEDEVVRTCELDPSPHQMEIPKLREFVVAARLNEFVGNYRRVDQNFDIEQWVGMNTLELRQKVTIPHHQPILQSLLECGDDVCLQGVVSKGGSADEKAEVAVFEGQRQFTAVFRGTTEQQCKPGAMIKAKKNGKGVAEPLDPEHGSVEVYSYYKEEYGKLEKDIFALLDKLTEQNPFCDVCFTGHSFGATLATLAAFRYANARPMMRVSCITLASPKVGSSAFKQLVNSSPNLKVMRLEFGQDGKCQLPSIGGYHVGHTLVLHGSLGHNSLKTTKPVLAYKFDAPKYKKFKTTHPDLRSYVNALEEVARLGLPWAKDFVGTSGQGVVVNNEARQMV